MTREEAIKILKAIRVYECYPKSASEETKEAIDMAIEALSAEAVPHGRLIDADRLKSYIDCGHLRPPTEVCFSELDVCNMIDKAPTVSAEAVEGWIPVSESLPDADDCSMDCMVTRKSKFVGNYVDIAVAEKNGTWTHEDWNAIVIDGKAKCISTRDADIIAWMPSPEPYKGGEDE